MEHIITAALFTGMRISELLGLTWDSVDMERGTITIDKQLRAGPEWDNPHRLVFTNAKGRNLFTQYVNNHFRALVETAGLEGVRLHDGPVKIGLNQKHPAARGALV